MNRNTILVATVVGSGLFALMGQEPARSGVFTAAQAEAGRIDYERTCGRCHAYNLQGRKGDPGELPPVSLLSDEDKKFVGTPPKVPAFVGPVFLSRWGMKTAAQLIARFQVTAGDSSFHFEGITDDTTVNIAAYVLQANGAKAGEERLTRATPNVVNSLIN